MSNDALIQISLGALCAGLANFTIASFSTTQNMNTIRRTLNISGTGVGTQMLDMLAMHNKKLFSTSILVSLLAAIGIALSIFVKRPFLRV